MVLPTQVLGRTTMHGVKASSLIHLVTSTKVAGCKTEHKDLECTRAQMALHTKGVGTWINRTGMELRYGMMGHSMREHIEMD
jgi:hypothetical protein